jgi:triosephosphate isomerase
MRNIVAGNWKSNKLMDEGLAWMADMAPRLAGRGGVEVVVAPPSPFLAAMADAAPEGLSVYAQNVSAEGMGAHTGEYTASMLKSCGVNGAIVGHSERRARFGDTDEVVARKVNALLDEGMNAVFCCGETLEERESGQAEAVVLGQLSAALESISKDQVDLLVIAYEPVWAIGTGKTATSDQAQAMHACIRQWLVESFGQDVADRLPLLYGGSCKASNAGELFSQPDINGGLIGGASLQPQDFVGVIEGHPASKA